MASPGYQGLVAIDYRGTRHVLGRTYNAYAIWDRAAGGVPIRYYALTAEGWSDAWTAFRELEGESVQPDQWLGGRPEALQPMTAGTIVGRSFVLWGGNLLRLVAIAAVLIPVQVLLLAANVMTMEVVERTVFLDVRQTTIDVPLWVDVLNNVMPYLLQALMTGPMFIAVGLIRLGRRPSVGEAYRVGLRYAPRLLAIVLLVSLIVLVLFIPALALLVVSAATGSDGLGLAAIIVVLVTIVPAVFLYVRLSLAPVVAVLERLGPVRAIRRSWELVGGVFWRLLGAFALVFLIILGFAFLLGIIVGIVFGSTVFTGDISVDEARGLFIAGAAIGLPIGLVLAPFGAVVTGLLYLDTRVRKEAYSIEDLERDLPARG